MQINQQKIVTVFLFFIFFLINEVNAQPLNGIYTIGGVTPNYTTLNSAVSALTSNGVNGPVVFNISAGIYQEQIIIPSITGASSTNTITFQSATLDSSSTTIRFNTTNNSNNYVFLLDGANFIRIQYLTIHTQGASYQIGIRLKANASNNIFKNNIIRGATSLANDNRALLYMDPSTGGLFQHNQILKNRFELGGYQLRIAANNPPSSFDNPIIGNQFTGNSGPSIFIENQTTAVIISNTITGTKTGTGTIEIHDCYGTSSIENNKISITTTSSVMRLQNMTVNIINNFIYGGGISLNGTMNADIFNNSFYNTQVGISTSPTSISANVFNNAFNSVNDYMIRASDILNPTQFFSDYNVFYTSRTLPFQNSTGTAITLEDWQNFGFDVHSIVAEAQYFSITDLHINNSLLLNGTGTPLAEVTYDIDGDLRDLTNPDIGADEFTLNMSTFRDLKFIDGNFPSLTCEVADSVSIKIANVSQIPITSFIVTTHLFGIIRDSSALNITIAPGDTEIVNLYAYYFLSGTQYDFKFNILLPNGLPDNNSIDNSGIITYRNLGPTKIHRRNNECLSDIELFVREQPNVTYLWSTGATTPSITTNASGVYEVTLQDMNGCEVTDAYTVN